LREAIASFVPRIEALLVEFVLATAVADEFTAVVSTTFATVV
jgi:hypothetical protein